MVVALQRCEDFLFPKILNFRPTLFSLTLPSFIPKTPIARFPTNPQSPRLTYLPVPRHDQALLPASPNAAVHGASKERLPGLLLRTSGLGDSNSRHVSASRDPFVSTVKGYYERAFAASDQSGYGGAECHGVRAENEQLDDGKAQSIGEAR